MRKIHRFLIVMSLSVSMLATSAFAAPSVNELNKDKSKAESEMQSLQNELTGLMTDIDLMERKLVSKGEEINAANKRLKEAEENEKKQYESMQKRIVVMYETGNTSLLQILFESGSIAELLQGIEDVQALHAYDRKQLQKYVEIKEEIAALKEKLEKEQKELISLQNSMEAKQDKLSKKISAKKAEIRDFEKQIKLQELAQKAAEEARRKAAEEEAKKKNQTVINAPTTSTNTGNTSNTGNSNNTGNTSNSNNTSNTNNSTTNSNGGVPYKGTGDPAVGRAIVAEARTYIGVDYLWGGNDRNGIDCSGLTKACHAKVGIYIDRWSGHQAIGGKAISSVAEALPGDIICYSGHVAIYIGNERVIHAPHTGTQVKEATVYLKEIIAIRRYW